MALCSLPVTLYGLQRWLLGRWKDRQRLLFSLQDCFQIPFISLNPSMQGFFFALNFFLCISLSIIPVYGVQYD